MKHGMMTVRSPNESVKGGAHGDMHVNHTSSDSTTGAVQQKNKPPMDGDVKSVSNNVLTWMTILSFLILGLGLSIAVIFGGL